MKNIVAKPSEFLTNNIGLLPHGRVLDIAMGYGRNAIYLAKRGYSVDGFEISEKAIVESFRLAEEQGVEINAKIIDLESDCHIPTNYYDVIICFNYLQRSLIPSIKNGIRIGGNIVYETYIVDQRIFGRPKNPEHLLKHNELLRLFQEFRCLRYREGIIDGKKAVAGIIAEKQ